MWHPTAAPGPYTAASRALLAVIAALLLLMPGLASAGEIDVHGVDNMSVYELCVVGEVTVAPVDDGTNITGFVVTVPSASTECATYSRYLHVRALYDNNADGIADGAYYMNVPAQVYSNGTLGIFGGKPAVYADNTYKTKVVTPPPLASTTILRYFSFVTTRKAEV